MKKIFAVLIFLASTAMLFNSCKKEFSCEDCLPGSSNSNKPPVADAGIDQVTILPKDSVLLDGSSSTDPDGTITSYEWKKVSGPSGNSIQNSASSKTIVKGLAAGLYHFELKVTDNGGLSAKDTVMIAVTQDPATLNPPVARAGNDQAINLPTNNVTLDGSASSDPDNNIVHYEWAKISGPLAFFLANPHSVQTQFAALVQGTYELELIVTDATGLEDRDTIQVKVDPSPIMTGCGSARPQVVAQLIPIGNVSGARAGIAVASAGDKIVFAAGGDGANNCSNTVNILNTTTNTWSVAALSNPGCYIKTVVSGTKIFFAGGAVNGYLSTKVDIYNAATNTWSTTTMPNFANRSWVDCGVAAGNKVLFITGNFLAGPPPTYTRFTFVDIYDLIDGSWEEDTLYNRTYSYPNHALSDAGVAATAIGNKVYFAGNASDWYAWDFGTISSTVDVYDATNGSWSTETNLNLARGFMASISVGSKNIWAGGLYKQPNEPFTNEVEIRDMNTGISTYGCLFQPNAFFSAVQKGSDVVFFTSSVNAPSYFSAPPQHYLFDIYHTNTNSWSIGVLPFNLRGSAIISVNNTIYVAGGYMNGILTNQVWKLSY